MALPPPQLGHPLRPLWMNTSRITLLRALSPLRPLPPFGPFWTSHGSMTNSLSKLFTPSNIIRQRALMTLNPFSYTTSPLQSFPALNPCTLPALHSGLPPPYGKNPKPSSFPKMAGPTTRNPDPSDPYLSLHSFSKP